VSVTTSQIRCTEARIDLLKRRIHFCDDLMLRASLQKDLKETEERLGFKLKTMKEQPN
jgi:hypothetical protein